MHRLIFGVLFLIFIISMLPTKKNHRSRRCACGKKHCEACAEQAAEFNTEIEQSPISAGMNEIDQTTWSRGFVPNPQQPNHTANLWKCEYSHPNIRDGQRETVFESDYPTPMRGSAVNMRIGDISDMHIISRFGATNSL